MATLADIAERLGVSKGTVSKALNDAPDISETMRKTIVETAVEMGYTRRQRKDSTPKKVCVLIENMEYSDPSQLGYEIITGFRQMAEPAGLLVDIVPLSEKLQKSIPYDVFMLQNSYIGSFIMGMTLNDPWMKDLKTSHTPAVLYDNYIRGNPYTAYVGVDNAEGMDLAVSYLKKLGHRNIGYLTSTLGSFYTQARHRAFFSAMKQNGLKAGSGQVGISYYVSECVGKHLPRLIEQGATALICSHDLLANAAMLQCQELGKRVPNDISVVGFDDLPMSAFAMPPLTTIRQDRPQLGKSAYYALNSLLNQVSIGTILLHAQLIVRNSSGERQTIANLTDEHL